MDRETRHECRILPKGVLSMKYCPYCGADFADGAASFCMECGKSLPTAEGGQKKPKEKPVRSQKRMEKKRKHPSPKPRKKHEKPVGEHVGRTFAPNLDFLRELFYCCFLPPGVHECRAKSSRDYVIAFLRQKDFTVFADMPGVWAISP